jgi:MFS family permease
MEFDFALSLVLTPFILPFITGLMAKYFGRKFWPWFFIGIPLPLIANILLLCLPDKTKKIIELRAVENDEVFDHLFINAHPKKFIDHENSFSATA